MGSGYVTLALRLPLLYLSGLLTGRLVLGPLTQVFHPLVLGQEVLLLGHLLPLHALVEQLPANEGWTFWRKV